MGATLRRDWRTREQSANLGSDLIWASVPGLSIWIDPEISESLDFLDTDVAFTESSFWHDDILQYKFSVFVAFSSQKTSHRWWI